MSREIACMGRSIRLSVILVLSLVLARHAPRRCVEELTVMKASENVRQKVVA